MRNDPPRAWAGESWRYAEANPIPEAGEFQIGDYGDGGSPGQAGEFKVTLIELANGGRWGFTHTRGLR